jgi:gamma-glutamyl-gamma-aminobutyrate hydrolase PuuD
MKRLGIIIVLASLAVCALSCIRSAPVIGISCKLNDAGAPSVSAACYNSVLQAGGVPVAIPMISDEAVLRKCLRRVDGVILVGGEDINPAYYGEAPIPELEEVAGYRDTCDMALAGLALKMRKPIFAICRGHQLLNVKMGGSLWQDIPAQLSDSVSHRGPSSRYMHVVRMDTTTVVGRMLTATGTDTLSVNSIHHQGVKAVGKGLTVVGTSPDGITECYVNDPAVVSSLILGTQFHPEVFAAAGQRPFLDLFEYFVDNCR